MLCCAPQCRPGATEQLPACQAIPLAGPNYGQLRCSQLLALEAKAPRLVVVSEFSGRGLKLHSEEENLRAGDTICGIKLLGGETHLVVRLTAPRTARGTTGALPPVRPQMSSSTAAATTVTVAELCVSAEFYATPEQATAAHPDRWFVPRQRHG